MDWKCITRNNFPEKQYLQSIFVQDHPLKNVQTSTEALKAKKIETKTQVAASTLCLALDGTDPLSQFAKLEEISPLNDPLQHSSNTGNRSKENVDLKFPSWTSRRQAILNKYTTSEKLSIVTSFLTGGEIIKSSTASVSDKVKHRLEQLDDFDEDPVRQMLNLSQQEYIMKIEQLNHQLRDAWNTDQRVKALKIAIQCSKLLSDTAAMQFYPSKFVLITDILDLFGKLVYDRLKKKSMVVRPGTNAATELPENFTADMIPETTKETCFNWFYKVASIRELLPRFYIEASIIKSYRFLGNADIEGVLNRLTLIVRGIGEPLVAAYARCYLCRVGISLSIVKPYLRQNFDDILSIYQTMFAGGVRSEIARQRLNISTYVSLYAPALNWILAGIAVGASDYSLDELVLKCQEKKNCASLFNALLSSLPHEFISARAMHFANILCKCDTEGYSRAELLRALGLCLNDTPPTQNQMYDVFDYIWRTVQTFTQVEEYVHCMEAWTPYVATHLTLREVNLILEDILRRSSSTTNAFEAHYAELQNIVDKIVVNFKAYDALLTSEFFLPVIDLFQKESVKQNVCRNVLRQFKIYSENLECINDPVIINAIMHVSKTLNDSVNALTVEDEKRQTGDYVNYFIRLVNFGNDFEQQMNFYGDARAAFTQLDSVYVTLVQSVNNLVNETYRIVKGKHSKKTSSFVKGCIAFNFVTIPSITHVHSRLDLYLLTGQVALLNGCLGQADACFEAGLKTIVQLPKQIEVDGKMRTLEPYLVSYLEKFLSTLIIAPDSPDTGTLFLLRLLIEEVQKYGFETNNLISIYLSILDTLSIMSQESYPLHIDNVISNDELYGHDIKYLDEINKLCTQITSHILINLKSLADTKNFRTQAKFSLDLFSKIITYSDVADEKAYQLAVNLWNLAIKHRSNLEQKTLIGYLQLVENEVQMCENDERKIKLLELYKKIKSKL